MKKVKFEVESKEVILKECEDFFNCKGVSVFVDNVFKGIEDVFNIEELQDIISNDISYIDTLYS